MISIYSYPVICDLFAILNIIEINGRHCIQCILVFLYLIYASPSCLDWFSYCYQNMPVIPCFTRIIIPSKYLNISWHITGFITCNFNILYGKLFYVLNPFLVEIFTPSCWILIYFILRNTYSLPLKPLNSTISLI